MLPCKRLPVATARNDTMLTIHKLIKRVVGRIEVFEDFQSIASVLVGLRRDSRKLKAFLEGTFTVLIIRSFLAGVAEDLVGFGDLVELRGVGPHVRLVPLRVVLQGQSLVSIDPRQTLRHPNLLLCRRSLQLQCAVVVSHCR